VCQLAEDDVSSARLPETAAANGKPSTAVQWHLVDSVYGQTAPLAVGAVAMLLVGITGWVRTGADWLLAWGALSACLFAARMALVRAYRRRSTSGDPSIWARRFTAGAWAAGALWGIASLVIVTEPNPYVHFLVISVQSGFLAGAAARNNALPIAGLGQVALTLVPVVLACLATRDPYYLLFAVFVLLNMFSTAAIVRYLGTQTVQLLQAREQEAALFEQVRGANDALAEANRRLEAMATTDALTGLVNRRGVDDALAHEWRRALREGGQLSLLMLDLDHFKAVNDVWGHNAGDDCLRDTAAALARTSRLGVDTVARYGGEEFAAILPNTDAAGAAQAAGRMRAAIAAIAIAHPAGPNTHLTISIGAATLTPAAGGTVGLLIELADQALYAAKAAGRNCVRSAAAGGEPPARRQGADTEDALG